MTLELKDTSLVDGLLSFNFDDFFCLFLTGLSGMSYLSGVTWLNGLSYMSGLAWLNDLCLLSYITDLTK